MSDPIEWQSFNEPELNDVEINVRTGELRYHRVRPRGTGVVEDVIDLGRLRRRPDGDFGADGADGLPLWNGSGGAERQFHFVVGAVTALVAFVPYQP
jgi:hypothetical protein